MKDEGERQQAAGGTRKAGLAARAGKVCLCADISFDGRLLEPADRAAAGNSGPLWWTRLLRRGRSVPAEPGAARTLFDAGRVDELCLRVRPCLDGRSGQPTLSTAPGGEASFFTPSLAWTLVRMATTTGGECLLYYRVAKPPCIAP